MTEHTIGLIEILIAVRHEDTCSILSVIIMMSTLPPQRASIKRLYTKSKKMTPLNHKGPGTKCSKANEPKQG